MAYLPLRNFYEKPDQLPRLFAVAPSQACSIQWQAYHQQLADPASVLSVCAGSPISYQWCCANQGTILTHPYNCYAEQNACPRSYLENNFYPPAYVGLQYSEAANDFFSTKKLTPKKIPSKDKPKSSCKNDKIKPTLTWRNSDSSPCLVTARNFQKDDSLRTTRPVSNRTALVNFTRCDSDDSGIAESPNSIASSITCKNFDDAPDSDECKYLEKLNTNSSRKRNEELKTEQQLQNKDEKFWTINDDKAFWERLRHYPPCYRVVSAIAEQVEYYLSDDYLLKDKYLLRQIRCKKDGYISIKLITSFKKVKKLTKDWTVVRSAIVRRSKNIVVSSEGLRIKRKNELSEILRKPRLLTSVLVIRLPEDYNSVDRMTMLFRGFGEISFVRLLRTDKSIPTDLKNYATQVPDIGKSLCAVVDFESAEDALTSVRTLKFFQREVFGCDENETRDEESLEAIRKYRKILKDLPRLGDMRLALLGPRVRRTLYRQDRIFEDLELAEENNGTEKYVDPSSLVKISSTTPDEAETLMVPKHAKEKRLRKIKIFSNDSYPVHAVRQPKGPVDGKNFVARRKNKKVM